MALQLQKLGPKEFEQYWIENMFEHSLDDFWKSIIDVIHDGLMIVDHKGNIISVNNTLEEMTGFPKKELLGQPCTVLKCDTCQYARDPQSKEWCILFRKGKLTKQQCVLYRKDGSFVHILKNATVLKDKHNQIKGAVEVMTDITDLMEKNVQIEAFKRELQYENQFHGIVGNSSQMQQVFDLITNAAQSEAPVFICGESGTGKELVAKAIHEEGTSSKHPYVKVNCAALNESLIESELFGHVKGAFTNAYKDRKGRFEAAHKGSIFLDEIGDLPASTQAKLLRVLEEMVIERVGDQTPIPVQTRIITATNKDLKYLVTQNQFREDLYYRINVIPIRIPPLRERPSDIPLLAEHFFHKIKMSNNSSIQGISNKAMKSLMEYSWPGNIRELRSVMEYAFVTCRKTILEPEDLPHNINNSITPDDQASTIKEKEQTEDTKKQQLLRALQEAGGNQSKAAQALGVSRMTIWKRMKKYGINVNSNLEY